MSRSVGAEAEDAGISAYSEEELSILHEVAERFGVPEKSLLELVNLELGFHRMGRRRGLFPAMRAVIADVAASTREGS